MYSALFVFILIFGNGVLCEKKVCGVEDPKCMTESGNRILGKFILGDKGVESSEPLHRDLIEANLPKIWMKLTNSSLSGMITCHLEVLKIIKKDQKYECHVVCSHLILKSEYEIRGEQCSVFLEGKGTCREDYFDNNLYFTGYYELKNKNGKAYIYFRKGELDLDIKGKVHYDYRNLFNGDKEKSDAALKTLNENCHIVDKASRLSIIRPFMDKYLDNINTYTGIVPLEDLFSLK